jgi:cytochrome c oxidase subunit 4
MSITRNLVVVWAALLALLACTIGASFILAGPLSLLVSMSIALAKAALIFWFYMHLKEEGPLVRVAAIGAGAWLLILFLLGAADYATRGIF